MPESFLPASARSLRPVPSGYIFSKTCLPEGRLAYRQAGSKTLSDLSFISVKSFNPCNLSSRHWLIGYAEERGIASSG